MEEYWSGMAGQSAGLPDGEARETILSEARGFLCEAATEAGGLRAAVYAQVEERLSGAQASALGRLTVARYESTCQWSGSY